jgi:hypothetical protein
MACNQVAQRAVCDPKALTVAVEDQAIRTLLFV